MQKLLVTLIPCRWTLLTQLQLTLSASSLMVGNDAPLWSLVEQCPQLQALAVHQAKSLCLNALTSLTCAYWEPRDLSSFQCSQLAHLHVLMRAHFNLLPSTLISLSLDSILPVLISWSTSKIST